MNNKTNKKRNVWNENIINSMINSNGLFVPPMKWCIHSSKAKQRQNNVSVLHFINLFRFTLICWEMSIAIYKQCELGTLLTEIGSKVLTSNCAKCLKRRLLRFIKFNWANSIDFISKIIPCNQLRLHLKSAVFEASFVTNQNMKLFVFLSTKMTNKYLICKFMGVWHRTEGERTLVDSGRAIWLAGTKRHSQFLMIFHRCLHSIITIE